MVSLHDNIGRSNQGLVIMRLVVGVKSNAKAVATSGRLRPTVWFDSWRQLAGVLSDENRYLLRLIQQRRPQTVLELSKLSGRAASNLSRTLKSLESHGLVRLNRAPGSRAIQPEVIGTEFLVVLD